MGVITEIPIGDNWPLCESDLCSNRSDTRVHVQFSSTYEPVAFTIEFNVCASCADKVQHLWAIDDHVHIELRERNVHAPRTSVMTAKRMSQLVLIQVRTEEQRARQKHGDHTPLNPKMDRRDKLVVLVEELGEVGRCLTYDQDHAGSLRNELIQLATMALMWADAEPLGK